MSAVVEGRDYGQEAIKRQLGALAREQREDVMRIGRVEFAKHAGLGSDSTVQQFEFGQRWPRPQTLRKLEEALGWRYRIMDDLLEQKDRRASTITLEELEAPAKVPAPRPLSTVSTAELLREVATRIESLQVGIGASDVREHFDLAASDDHIEGEDDRD